MNLKYNWIYHQLFLLSNYTLEGVVAKSRAGSIPTSGTISLLRPAAEKLKFQYVKNNLFIWGFLFFTENCTRHNTQSPAAAWTCRANFPGITTSGVPHRFRTLRHDNSGGGLAGIRPSNPDRRRRISSLWLETFRVWKLPHPLFPLMGGLYELSQDRSNFAISGGLGVDFQKYSPF